MSDMARDPVLDDAFRNEVCDWLRANDIDPAATPANPFPKIANGMLTILQKVRRGGSDVLNGQRTDVLKEAVTVPLKVPPSPDIAEWLRPKCPTCGR